MRKTVFHIPQMDCPAEERLIRMKLEDDPGVRRLEFDLPRRRLAVYHDGGEQRIVRALQELGMKGKTIERGTVGPGPAQTEISQRKVLGGVLGVNFFFFLFELAAGLWAGSMGLVADSLDMLADAFVYGIALWAAGGTLRRKRRVAAAAGYFQIVLAMVGFAEVVRRVVWGEGLPDVRMMIGVSFLALLANGVSLRWLRRAAGKEEAHMRAGMIFTSNDVIINAGVILAGVLVALLESRIPDLVVGAGVFVLVLRGGRRILMLK